MSKGAQELSIAVSCSLLHTRIFIPPFNKWNKDTEDICNSRSIKLIKFESGWRCGDYHEFDSRNLLWYVHPWRFTLDTFKKWVERE
jgi:hypothetical protein